MILLFIDPHHGARRIEAAAHGHCPSPLPRRARYGQRNGYCHRTCGASVAIAAILLAFVATLSPVVEASHLLLNTTQPAVSPTCSGLRMVPGDSVSFCRPQPWPPPPWSYCKPGPDPSSCVNLLPVIGIWYESSVCSSETFSQDRVGLGHLKEAWFHDRFRGYKASQPANS